MSDLLGKIFGKDSKDGKSSKDKSTSQHDKGGATSGKWPDFCEYTPNTAVVARRRSFAGYAQKFCIYKTVQSRRHNFSTSHGWQRAGYFCNIIPFCAFEWSKKKVWRPAWIRRLTRPRWPYALDDV